MRSAIKIIENHLIIYKTRSLLCNRACRFYSFYLRTEQHFNFVDKYMIIYDNRKKQKNKKQRFVFSGILRL